MLNTFSLKRLVSIGKPAAVRWSQEAKLSFEGVTYHCVFMVDDCDGIEEDTFEVRWPVVDTTDELTGAVAASAGLMQDGAS